MRPARRSARLLVLAVGLTLVSCRPDSKRSGPETGAVPEFPRAPVVLISIDTLRSDRVGAYGYQGVETPAIDGLGREGIVFERAYSNVPLTFPSHVSLLTGLLPPDHGVRDNLGYRLEASEVPYLPRLLHQRGYTTGGAVSAFVLNHRLGLAEGFDFYEDSVPYDPDMVANALQRPGTETLSLSREWLESVAGKGPFFFFFHLYEPHTPYAPPEPFASRYQDPYDGEVAAADSVVGQLLGELRRLEVYDEALIVLLSDHGEGLGEHGEDEHGLLLYRPTLQVPLVVKLPGGVRSGSRVSRPVELVDVTPTVLSLVGAPLPDRMDGSSLLATAEGPRQLYAETFFPRIHLGWSEVVSLIEGRYHYIESPDPELYDVVDDPEEEHDLLRDQRRVAARLRDALAAVERSLSPPEPVDAKTRAALAALGYLGGSAGAAEGPLPSPKTQLKTLDVIRNAFVLYRRGDYEAAAAAYRHTVEANPRFFDGWEYLGRSLRRLGRHDEAGEAFLQALKLSDRAPDLAATAADSFLQAHRPEKALEVTQAELLRAPDYLRLRLFEVRALTVLGRHDEALAEAEEAVANDPQSADAFYQRGAVRKARRELGRAEADFRHALELDPQHASALHDLAVMLTRRGTVDEARELLQRLVEGSSDDDTAARARDLLASIAIRQGDLEQAETLARQAVGQRGTLVAPLVTLAGVLREKGELEPALALAQQAESELGGQPPEPELLRGLYLLLGNLYGRLGKGSQAEAAFKEEIHRFPDAYQAYSELTLLYALRGDNEAARDTLREMVETNQAPEAYATAVKTLKVLGDPRSAAGLLGVALRRFPDDPELRKLAAKS